MSRAINETFSFIPRRETAVVQFTVMIVQGPTFFAFPDSRI